MEVKKTPPPLKVCPRCFEEQRGLRCPHDQSYLITKEAQLGAKGDGVLGCEIGGKYGVVERLGMGGMGAVYKAIDPERNLIVAIKVLREAYAKHPAIRERFIREAEAGASLNHPNVVPLIDFGIESSGRLWLAMEYAEGWTLRDEINHNGAFTVNESVELIRQILKGLSVAHDSGLIHRDLKHDNIMYHGRRERFIAKIVDFGVVKSEAADLDRTEGNSGWKPPQFQRASQPNSQGAFDLSEALIESEDDQTLSKESEGQAEAVNDNSLKSKALTAVGMMVGSPSYMAPEQIRGLKVGPPADLYALAVVAYEILAARRLFTVNDYETLLKDGAKRDAPRLVFSARGEVIPEPLADLIHNALAHDPTDRYPDAHTMLLALDQMNFQATDLPPNLFCELPSFLESEDLTKRREVISQEDQKSLSTDLSSQNLSLESIESQKISLVAPPVQKSKYIRLLISPLVVTLVVWLFAKLLE